ncbi:hypothetical protein Ctob_010867 [Chrysochromulina tobinii]|uniref:PX domain-containing protein n=1 Tax=Chrysochromulina tobinii TaxID=1460289 RepID=A0A0M0JJS6_9EUKA|nr:hypothetical protein Ctob_010867 [Chrysochromulina tobinii]|eukprot:KOO26745.1 hypothetical protein Ctob_010867 [Chrysochromulina sp. CCMP291]
MAATESAEKAAAEKAAAEAAAAEMTRAQAAPKAAPAEETAAEEAGAEGAEAEEFAEAEAAEFESIILELATASAPASAAEVAERVDVAQALLKSIDSITISSFTDEHGYTEYRIRTTVALGDGTQRVFATQKRLTLFELLHKTLCPQLVPQGLGEGFVIGALRMPRKLQSRVFKEQRRKILEGYLQQVLALTRDQAVWQTTDVNALPRHVARLRAFLGVDA